MPRYGITGEWNIELEGGYRRKADGGDVVFWEPDAGRTVYASVFVTANVEAEEAIAKMLEGRAGAPTQTFDRVEAGLVGHAYLLPEGEDDKDGNQRQWGLNTWTAAKDSVACVTFYFDDVRDLPWALKAWQSVRCGPCETRAYFN